MSRDPRLAAWLDATREALDAARGAPQEALETLAARREELATSLRGQPLQAPVDDDLPREIDAAERALQELLDALAQDARARVEELRRVRGAASGYRPVTANHPAFVSRTA